MTDCILCNETGGELLWQNATCRVVQVNDPHYPGFCRVIWKRHVAEMSDLSTAEQVHLMSVVFGVEHCLRDLLNPTKVNLASFGNVVPHLHWHVIPRFSDDRHFPDAYWATPLRADAPAVSCPADLLATRLLVALQGCSSFVSPT